MPYNWWTRKNLVLAAAVVALAFIGFVVIGVSYPEPAASALSVRTGSAAGWPSSSRPAAGPGTARPWPSASPKSRCADGCGRNRIGRKRSWPEPELPMLKTVSCHGGRVAAALVLLPAGVALAQGAPSGGTAPAQHHCPRRKANGS
jgi:hypothetical protein